VMTIFMSAIANVTECCCRRISLLRFFLDNSRARVCVCACFKREKKFVAAGGIEHFFGSFFLSVYGAYVPYVGRKRGDNERSFLWLISWYIAHFNFKALKRSFDVARLKEYSVAKIAREVVSGGSHYCIFNTRRKRFVAVRCRRACVLPDRFMYVPVESYVGLLLCDEFSQRL
jgi:hypothetical protein